MEVKQVIVVRKDLNMRKGKLAAQVAHASLKVIIDRMCKENMQWWFELWRMIIDKDEPLYEWLHGSFTKIVLGVNSEKELMELYVEAQMAKLPHALIRDAAKTEFKDPTYTALAIGPAEADKIDKITGGLKLL